MEGLKFGELLKEKRTHLGLSLRELEEKSSITSAYIFRLEKGQRENPGFTTVCDLALALELQMQDIFRSFGYDDIAKKEETSPQPDCIIGDHILEVKTLSTTQQEMMQQVLSLVMKYATENNGSELSYIHQILQTAEEFRKTYQAQR